MTSFSQKGMKDDMLAVSAVPEVCTSRNLWQPVWGNPGIWRTDGGNGRLAFVHGWKKTKQLYMKADWR